jgi:hypothetical protein
LQAKKFSELAPKKRGFDPRKKQRETIRGYEQVSNRQVEDWKGASGIHSNFIIVHMF